VERIIIAVEDGAERGGFIGSGDQHGGVAGGDEHGGQQGDAPLFEFFGEDGGGDELDIYNDDNDERT